MIIDNKEAYDEEKMRVGVDLIEGSFGECIILIN